MADAKKDSKQKDAKPKPKAKAPSSDKPEKKAAKPPKADKAAKADTPVEAPAPKPEPPKREPADPRLKVMKKLQGRYLPRGPLRDRLHTLLSRWNSSEDHGGVTYDELKSLHTDWRASREKRARTTA